MHLRLIPLSDVTPSDVEAWHRLADHAVWPNMYLDPRFLVPARHRGDEASDVRVVVVQEGGEWLAALAVSTKPVARRVPVLAATTGGEFTTVHSDRHHPLLRRGREAEALEALLRGLTSVGLPGLVQLRRFPGEGPLADTLAEVLGRTPMRAWERRRDAGAFAPREAMTVPELPPLVDGVLVDPPLATDHMATDERRNMRRGVRGLVRETGGPLELHDLSADPGAEDDFVELQAAGWKGDVTQGGSALRLDPRAERWFREVVGLFRRDGDATVLRLAAGGQTLWHGYALRSGGAYFGFLDAYAEQHRRYSPGAIGRIANLTYLFATTDAPFFDPGFDSRYTAGARLFPASRPVVDVLVSTRGLTAHAVLRAAPTARRLGLLAS
ncbi:GNAT family N-acetyltransferase [Cellulomonas sp. ES6]|uniref:GNAT family N-acetyltransferase n=1 Tax=Cellulomonas sp. ES6 TaxID=3039384 RepID=UPI0024B66FBF|nr:GNAT family N-acetyltransferase [Cellulomonas sp. ES6]WHP16864.1 GNAT family N-acetyltransferase [Cellulomonas sp. ES6]